MKPWKNLARIAGITDIAGFEKCLKNKQTGRIIDRDIRIGKKIGVDGTPTLIINGRMVSGAMTSAELLNLINRFSR
jgi:protein-disulfide isomerase